MKEKSGQTPFPFYISIDIVDGFNVILFILFYYHIIFKIAFFFY